MKILIKTESRMQVDTALQVEEEDNTLRDGTMIDLCGATLLWRSSSGLQASPVSSSERSSPVIDQAFSTAWTHIPRTKGAYHCLQSRRELEYNVAAINAGRPQCPVGLNTLVLPSKNTLTESDKQPYVYLNCGHVHGQHNWGPEDPDTKDRTCPMCRKVSLWNVL